MALWKLESAAGGVGVAMKASVALPRDERRDWLERRTSLAHPRR